MQANARMEMKTKRVHARHISDAHSDSFDINGQLYRRLAAQYLMVYIFGVNVKLR